MIPLYAPREDGTFNVAFVGDHHATRDEYGPLWLCECKNPDNDEYFCQKAEKYPGASGDVVLLDTHDALIGGGPPFAFWYPMLFKSLESARSYARRYAKKHDIELEEPLLCAAGHDRCGTKPRRH